MTFSCQLNSKLLITKSHKDNNANAFSLFVLFVPRQLFTMLDLKGSGAA